MTTRRLFEWVGRELKDVALSHLSDVAEEPAGDAVVLAIRSALRLSPSILVRSQSLAPYERVLFLLSRHDIEEVLDRDDVFSVSEYGARMKASSGAFFLGMDGGSKTYAPEQAVAARALARVDIKKGIEAAAFAEGDVDRVGRIIRDATVSAIDAAKASVKPGQKGRIDAAKQLADLVPLALAKDYFGVAPLLDDNRNDVLVPTAQAVAFYVFNFFAAGPKYAVPGTDAGIRLHRHLVAQIEDNRLKPDTVLSRMVEWMRQTPGASWTPHDVARTLAGVLVGSIAPGLGLCLHSIARLVQLDETAREPLVAAAANDDTTVALGFAREGARFSPYPPTIYRICTEDFTVGVGTVHERRIEAGTLVVPVFLGAAFDGDFVHLPEQFIPSRSPSEYLLFGHGRHECLGKYIGEAMMARMVLELFKLPDLRRAEQKRSTTTSSSAKFAPFGGELLLEFSWPPAE
ncbi:MAG TPA: cytochrome P450 [Polyangiaceae bacterium]|nr:cytochrome P450 [Polyangiaceae bacterium]